MTTFVSQAPAIREWFIATNSKLNADFSEGLIEKPDFWQQFNALQDEYGRRLMAAHTAYELWWIEQDVPECKRNEQAHIRARLAARGLVGVRGAQLALL
jgi:hypothetical protein